jgi:predicted nuclease with TOPRIM domain
MDQAQEKLRDGLEDLHKIAATRDLLSQIDKVQEKLLAALEEQKREIIQNSLELGAAFHKINNALEDKFSNLLKSNPNVSAEELTRIGYQHSRWMELTDAMQRYYGLSDAEKNAIMNRNGYRSNYGYGGPFLPTYAQVEQYAQLVRDLMERY